MSRTFHHRNYYPGNPRSGKEPASYRRMINRLSRARINQSMREEKFDALPHHRKKKGLGWYW